STSAPFGCCSASACEQDRTSACVRSRGETLRSCVVEFTRARTSRSRASPRLTRPRRSSRNSRARAVQATAFWSDQAVATLAPQLIDEVAARFAGLRILVNNAAIGVEAGKAVDDPRVNTAALRPRPDARHQVHRRHRNHPRGCEGRARQRPDHQHRLGHRSPRWAPRFADYAAIKAGLTGYTRASLVTWRCAAPRST
ncbi:MAG: putative oxidoreductase, partial [Acidimicrobiaceae bacterium]|nr:putative oxidoreductase [Acidimicrobiaceae bacterium]